MKDSFYVGIVCHGKKLFKAGYKEKLVLYSQDGINYLDLISDTYYTTDKNNRDYIEKESLIPTDVSEYREDYLYLLSKYSVRNKARKKYRDFIRWK